MLQSNTALICFSCSKLDVKCAEVKISFGTFGSFKWSVLSGLGFHTASDKQAADWPFYQYQAGGGASSIIGVEEKTLALLL